MIRFTPALLVFLFPIALCADDKKEEPKGMKFSSKEGKFSVTMPGKPTTKTNTTKTPGGDIDVHLFLIDQKDRAYIVGYNDYKAGALDPDTNKVLAGVITGNAKAINGKVKSEEKITIGKKKYPGREVRIEFGDKMLYRANIFLVGNRLYQVVALGPADFAKSKAVDDYLKSFAIEE